MVFNIPFSMKNKNNTKIVHLSDFESIDKIQSLNLSKEKCKYYLECCISTCKHFSERALVEKVRYLNMCYNNLLDYYNKHYIKSKTIHCI